MQSIPRPHDQDATVLGLYTSITANMGEIDHTLLHSWYQFVKSYHQILYDAEKKTASVLLMF